jgi:glycosyltransferase involved in cell wall biosynthesis
VLGQPHPAIEHLVVDGASSDGTVELLRECADPRLRWVSEPDGGVYDAMNKGARLASGDYLLFLGADDRLACDLAVVGRRLMDPRCVYYGDAYWPTRHRLYDGRFGVAKFAIKNICQQAIFYPRAAFAKYAFDPRYRVQADWELNMRCFSDPEFRFEYFPVLVSTYNDLDGMSSRLRDVAMERDYTTLLWRHFPAYLAVPLITAVFAARLARRVGILRAPEKAERVGS